MSSAFARKFSKISALNKLLNPASEPTDDKLIDWQKLVQGNVASNKPDLALMQEFVKKQISGSPLFKDHIGKDGKLIREAGNTFVKDAREFVEAFFTEAGAAYDKTADRPNRDFWVTKMLQGMSPSEVIARYVDNQLNRTVTLKNKAHQDRVDNLKSLFADASAKGWVVVETVGSVASVNEGEAVTFVVTDLSAKPGDEYVYEITGIQAADIESGSLAGKVTFDAKGRAEVVIRLKADRLTEGTEKLKLTVAGSSAAVDVTDTSLDQVYQFSADADSLEGNPEANNVFVGAVASNFNADGTRTTFNPGDRLDGAAGQNTLRLFMDQGAVADGVEVSNIQTLDLRLNAGGTENPHPTTNLFMTDWDASLEQMNIRSNKSNLVVHEQKTIADISITDQSTENQASSYDFRYAAGVLDGSSDHLNLSVDNVNGEDGADVKVDAGMESIAINVADRQGTLANPDLYASDIKLTAAGVADIDVTGGRTGQTFTLQANDVAQGADFNSTEFVGDMDLTTNKIRTASFGVGDDKAEVDGQASLASFRYDLGQGDNEITVGVVDGSDADGLALGGQILAGNGDNQVIVNGDLLATGSISLGNGDNFVSVRDGDTAGNGTVLGTVAAGNGDNTVTVMGDVAGESSVTLGTLGDGDNTLDVGGEIKDDATVQLGNGDNRVTVLGDIQDDASVTLGDGANGLTVGANVDGKAAVGFGNGDNVAKVVGDVKAEASVSFGNGGNLMEVAGAVTGTNASSRVDIAFGRGDNTLTVGGAVDTQVITLAGVQNDTQMSFRFETASGAIYRVDYDSTKNFDGGRIALNKLVGGSYVPVNLGTVSDQEDVEAAIAAELGALKISFFDQATDFMTIWAGVDFAQITRMVQVNAQGVAISGPMTIVNGQFVDLGSTDSDGNVENATITFGDGTNFMQVDDNVISSSITFGNGDGNELIVGGSVSAAASGTITFGDGANNTLTIGEDLNGDAVVFGNGAGNSFAIGADVTNAASITVGNGGSSGSVDGVVNEGSTITFGSAADQLTIGDFSTASPLVSGSGTVIQNVQISSDLTPDTATVIRMGGDDDHVTLQSAGTGYVMSGGVSPMTPAPQGFLVESGGFIHGEGGSDDTFTVVTKQDDDTNVIGRTQLQKVEIELFKPDTESYQAGDIITISFSDGATALAPISYTVVDADIEQGNGVQTSANIAAKVVSALNASLPFQAVFTAEAIDGTAGTSPAGNTAVYLTSVNPQQDFTITSSHGTVTVMQISDARVTGFENVELVVENVATSGDGTTVQADFDLINGAQNILLDSQVQRIAKVETFTAASDIDGPESLSNGAYTEYTPGGVTTFDLDNLQGGEKITVRGHETGAAGSGSDADTGTGNQQVNRINVDARVDAHKIGDKITVEIGEVTMVYTVVAEDLVAGQTEAVDADRIAAKLRDMINAKTAEHGFTAVVDVDAQVRDVTDALLSTYPSDGSYDGLALDNFDDYDATGYNTGAWVTLTGAANTSAAVSVAHTRTQVKTTADATSPLVIDGDEPGATQTIWSITAALGHQTNKLLPGDVITVTRAAAEGVPAGSASYTVTAEDCLRLNADKIAAELAQQLGGTAEANWGVVDFGGAAAVVVTRTTEPAVANSQTALSGNNRLQEMTSTDDSVADVIIDATLAEGATDTTMDLTVDGYGNFDLDITANKGTNGYNTLAMTLADAHDHTVDTQGDVWKFTQTVDLSGKEVVATGTDVGDWVIDLVTEAGDTVRVSFNASEATDKYSVRLNGGTATSGNLETVQTAIASALGADTVTLVDNTLTVVVEPSGNANFSKVDAVISRATTADTTSTTLSAPVDSLVGNFSNSITVDDSVDTSGAAIELENVLAREVNTSASKADFTIDQYTPRKDSTGVFSGETITVTTGTGDDHLTTLAQSALETGSSINLGAGSNMLSLGWGTGVVLQDVFGDVPDEYNSPKYEVSTTFDASADTVLSVAELIPGGSSKTLPTVAVGTRVDGKLNGGTDRDAFAVTLEAGKTYQFTFFTSASLGYDGADTDFFAYGPDRVRIVEGLFADGEEAGDDEDLDVLDTDPNIYDVYEGEARVFTPTVSGTYYFEVAPHDDSDPDDLGTYGFEVSELVSTDYLISLDFSSMNFSGDLAEFELLNDILILSNKTLVMPGGVDDVEALTLTDLQSNGSNDLTVVGAANDFTIESGKDFDLGKTGNTVGVLTVTDAGGDEITGDLDVSAIIDVRFNIGNTNLASLTVTAESNDAEIFLSGNPSDAEFNLGEVVIAGGTTGGDDGDLFVSYNNGTTVNISSVVVTAEDNADLEIRNNTGLEMDVGSVTLEGGDPDVFIEDNTRSSITLGAVSIINGSDSSETNELTFGGNSDSDLLISGGLTISSKDTAQVQIGNDGRINVDSSVVIGADIDLFGSTDANLEVENNTRTDVSLAEGGTITMIGCSSDTTLSVVNNLNNYNPVVNGPDNGGLLAKSYSIALGDVVMDSGRTASVTVASNNDGTRYGDLTVSMGDVDLFAYSDARVTVGGGGGVANLATTVEVGNVDIRAQQSGYVELTHNAGKVYSTTETVVGGSSVTTYEVDYADITVGNVKVDVDQDANFAASANSLALVDVGTVDLDAVRDATFGINDNTDSAVTTGAVTVDAGRNVSFSISNNDESTPNYTGYATEASVTTGSVTTDAGGTTTIAIDRNTGVTYENGTTTVDRSTVTVNGSLTSTSAGSLTATVSDNDRAVITLGGTAAAGEPKREVSLTATGAIATNTLTMANNVSSTIALASTSLTAQAAASVLIGEVNAGNNDNENTSISMVDLSVTSSSDAASFAISHNNGDISSTGGTPERTTVNIAGPVTVSGETTATVSVNNNSYVDANLAATASVRDTLTIQSAAAEAGVEMASPMLSAGDADLVVSSNTFSTVRLGNLVMDADNDADVLVQSNSGSTVSVGTVDIDAERAASLSITSNSGSDIEMASTRTTVGSVTTYTRGAMTIDAASVGEYPASAAPTVWSFDVSGNTNSGIYLGNIEISAAGAEGDSDVTMRLDIGEDLGGTSVSTIDTGSITIDADSDVYFTATNRDIAGSVLRTGSINITSGREPVVETTSGGSTTVTGAAVSSDLYFKASNLEGNDLNDNTGTGDAGQQITLTALSRTELNTDDSVKTLGEGDVYANIANAPDLTALTVSGTNAEIYLTGTMGPTDSVQGTFTLDLSGMTGTFDTITTYDPLGASADHNRAQDDGTYVVTVGATFDSDPRDVVVKIGNGDLIYNAQHSNFVGSDSDLVYSYINDEDDWFGDEGWFSLGGSGASYLDPVPQVQKLEFWAYSDVEDTKSSVFDVQVGGVTYEITVQGDTTLGGDNDEGNFRGSGSLGSTGISYVVSGSYTDEHGGGGDDGNGRGTVTVTFTGPADGSSFTLSGITDFVGGFAGNLTSNNITTQGAKATDGLGNTASEVFTFVGGDIGDIVIGGFRPNGFFAQTEVDRLDFSDFAGVTSAADLIIRIEEGGSVGDSNGYFDDVIIDFVNQNYGSVRLVGVGEYFNSEVDANGIANSIIFA